VEVSNKSKKSSMVIIYYLLAFCLFAFTIGQFIPVYFVDSDLRMWYYLSLFILLIISTVVSLFKNAYHKSEKNIVLAILGSLTIGFFIFILFGLWTIGLLFNVWDEGATYYISKSNPKVKIISRYINEGAFGGGTEPEDYHMVVHRPFLFIFKIETSVDTTSIDKSKWIKALK
jgi:hypothetical protein